jgi:orotidine-5'-phosphate decarboxylase
LAQTVARRESQVVLGLDPDPRRLWPLDATRAPADGRSPTEHAAAAVTAHCRALIDAAGPACAVVKPQLACFERLGAPGREALGAVVEHAREAGLLVLADAKRGDIDVTNAAYGQALFGGLPTPFGDVPGLDADAATINPYMGIDTLQAVLVAAREREAGIFVLVRTSNPGAADIEDLPLATGEPLWERVAAIVERLGVGEPLADVAAVAGSTAPEHLTRMRELMPRAPFLLPGIGAQGGDVAALAAAFVPGKAGGLASASRSIAQAGELRGEDPAQAARAEAERIRAVAWALA